MSKLEVKEIGPISGETDVTLGQSGGTVTLAEGATAVGFGPEYPIGQVRAWVNFNGTGTVAIRESLNVSSITDHGEGQYTVNFTTAMVDANYCTNVTGTHDPGNYVSFGVVAIGQPPTTSAVRAEFLNQSGLLTDVSFAQMSIVR